MLLKPIREYEASYRAYVQELGREERYPFVLDFDHGDFDALIARLEAMENGQRLPEGSVASSTFWLIEDGDIVGVSNLRHRLNARLRRCGGHIGLGVRPSRRGRGIGAELMRRTLEQGFRRGMDELHIHCYRANPASARIIEANGGMLHSEIEHGVPPQVVQRFVVRAPT